MPSSSDVEALTARIVRLHDSTRPLQLLALVASAGGDGQRRSIALTGALSRLSSEAFELMVERFGINDADFNRRLEQRVRDLELRFSAVVGEIASLPRPRQGEGGC